jgi:hypothetical protein
MKTSKSRVKQQQPGKQSKNADRRVLKEITEEEIDAWFGHTRASDIRSVEIQLVKLYDAANSKNLEALKEISRSSRGMVGRMAKYALSVVSTDQEHKATRASSYALRQIFYLSGEYGLGWNIYLQRLRKEAAPLMIKEVGAALKEVRQAHAQNK